MDKKYEIESLNVDDLDVEELERRIEMASGSADASDVLASGYCAFNFGGCTRNG